MTTTAELREEIKKRKDIMESHDIDKLLHLREGEHCWCSGCDDNKNAVIILERWLADREKLEKEIEDLKKMTAGGYGEFKDLVGCQLIAKEKDKEIKKLKRDVKWFEEQDRIHFSMYETQRKRAEKSEFKIQDLESNLLDFRKGRSMKNHSAMAQN